MSQSLLGFKNLTPVKSTGSGGLRAERKAVCARTESRSFPLLICASASPHPQHSVLTQRYIMSARAAQTQWSVDPGLKKALQWTVGRRCQNGGLGLGVGRTPPKSLEFKNLKPTGLLPLLSPLQLTVLLFSLLPLSLPLSPPLSLGVPSPVCLNWSVQHTLYLPSGNLSLSFYF